YKEKVESSDKDQQQDKQTLETYIPKLVLQCKIYLALKLYAENKDGLEQVAKEFGVQAGFIVAVWGLECNFGT
ncbi:lytic murein transglycosylase, partial [Pseudoalteromonas sp. S2893]